MPSSLSIPCLIHILAADATWLRRNIDKDRKIRQKPQKQQPLTSEFYLFSKIHIHIYLNYAFTIMLLPYMRKEARSRKCLRRKTNVEEMVLHCSRLDVQGIIRKRRSVNRFFRFHRSLNILWLYSLTTVVAGATVT